MKETTHESRLYACIYLKRTRMLGIRKIKTIMVYGKKSDWAWKKIQRELPSNAEVIFFGKEVKIK